jgi:predicted nucleotidyltransferase component of viral defense system
MTKPEPIRWHENQALFREAVAFTSARTGFVPRLVEKDYYCTLALQHLCAGVPGLVFKGGTCLAKVHAQFYRLSEDLDFAIHTPPETARSGRSRLAAPVKKAVAKLGEDQSGLRVIQELTGSNNSTQYQALVGYQSAFGGQEEPIKIEVGLREPVLTPEVQAGAQTLLLNPLVNAPMVPAVQVSCLSRGEAMAEKLRAALTRRDVAIRDFYDMDYAVRRLRFDAKLPAFLELVKKKLSIPGNEAVDVSEGRLATLRSQVDGQLKPVLRSQDLAEFDLKRACALIADLAATVCPG